jgi:hypothetical protein
MGMLGTHRKRNPIARADRDARVTDSRRSRATEDVQRFFRCAVVVEGKRNTAGIDLGQIGAEHLAAGRGAQPPKEHPVLAPVQGHRRNFVTMHDVRTAAGL